MIKWPHRALVAIRKLYEPLQDIDVYVEDVGDEAFYTHLLKRLGADEIRIARVFACGNRGAVVDAARTYTGPRKALFLIDGDLEWVTGQPAPTGLGALHRLDAYCIENLLICKDGARFILMQDAAMTEYEAGQALGFDTWMESISPALLELFSAFAAVHIYCPQHKTVAIGVGTMCSQDASGATVLDLGKVNAHTQSALSNAKSVANPALVDEIWRRTQARAALLPDPLCRVSGKDFLLPLLDFRLQQLGCRVRRKALRIRLAMACALSPFATLTAAMRQVAR